MYISHYILTCLPTDTRQLFSVFIMIIIFKAKEKAFVEGSGYLYIRDLKPRFVIETRSMLLKWSKST